MAIHSRNATPMARLRRWMPAWLIGLPGANACFLPAGSENLPNAVLWVWQRAEDLSAQLAAAHGCSLIPGNRNSPLPAFCCRPTKLDERFYVYCRIDEVKNMFSERNERLALVIATVIFGVLGVFQLYRAATGLTVVVGGTMLPVWPSFLVGCAALFMAFWLGGCLRHHKPTV